MGLSVLGDAARDNVSVRIQGFGWVCDSQGPVRSAKIGVQELLSVDAVYPDLD
jgi:hypothetical protein